MTGRNDKIIGTFEADLVVRIEQDRKRILRLKRGQKRAESPDTVAKVLNQAAFKSSRKHAFPKRGKLAPTLPSLLWSQWWRWPPPRII
jgi:hypothetical protein